MKILVADDESAALDPIAVLVRNAGFEAVLARNGEEAWEILSGRDAPRLAILDWMMPGVDGPELCRRLRARTVGKYVYVILLSARTERSDVIAGLDAGADDYLTKPVDDKELMLRIRNGKRILDLEERLRTDRDMLAYQAAHDPLTGVLNRAAVLERLRQERDRADRNKTALSVIMVDLDRFKQINDSYGHPGGDVVLREAAGRIVGRLRAYDVLGRYGGEEFLVVAPGCNAEEAATVAERLRRGLAEAPIPVGDTVVTVTGSFGVAATQGPGPLAIADLVRIADEALYRAKSAGRNRVVTAEA